MSKRKQCQDNRNKTKLIMKGNPSGYFKTDTKMNFKVGKSSSYYKKVHDLPLFPTFNNDRRFYTPAFILPHIEGTAAQEYQKIHEHKVQQSLRELLCDQIVIKFVICEQLVPKPRSKHKYCGVCRSYYDEYLQHCQSKQHCGHLQQSKFQKIISNQCEKFQNKFVESELLYIEKSHSFDTKVGDEENSTESLQKHLHLNVDLIQKIESIHDIPVSI